jgi:nucleoside-diphosphate-sugar epimerase
VISLFARAMIEGRRPTICGDGRQTRDFTFIANVVAANLLAMRARGRLDGAVYNVGAGRRPSIIARAKSEITPL